MIVGSNGKTAGITLPSADGQEAVIRKAYAKAGIGFSQTEYVECHGTGTKVGDAIEGKSKTRLRSAAEPRGRKNARLAFPFRHFFHSPVFRTCIC